MQAEALSKLKRGGEQTVRVEHVHVYPGGQAIVGTVTRDGGNDGRRRQTDGTIDLRALAFAAGSAVLGETRSGTPCQKPAAKGKKRCKLHGGADGIGAPWGERNGAYKHVLRSYEAIAQRRALRALIRAMRADVKSGLG